jgi:hypothetical protein
MLPIILAILVSLTFTQLLLLAEPYRRDSLFSLFGYGERFSPLSLLIMAVTTVTILFVFLRILKTGKEFAVKILVASFLAAGGLSTLLLGRFVLTSMGLESQLPFIILAAIAFIEMFFAFLVSIGLPFSQEVRNRIFVISSGSLGAFLGILAPVLLVVGISTILSITDAILILGNRMQRILGEAKYEKLITEMTFSAEEWAIGIGDLVCYSMIASSTSVNFGVLACGVSLFLMLLGSFFTMKLAAKRILAPGLPLVITLGLLPSIILLISS